MTGILGLAPGDEDSNPLFIDYLFNAGKIKKKQFSILLNPRLEGESFIAFGGLPTGYSAENMTCHKISGSYHWELKLNALAYKGKQVDIGSTHLAFMDTGSTISLFP